MSKFILSLSLFGIAILFVFGLVAPASPVVWLASTSTNFALLRLVLMLVLGVLTGYESATRYLLACNSWYPGNYSS